MKTKPRTKKTFVDAEIGIVQLSFSIDLQALKGLNRKQLEKTFVTIPNPLKAKQQIRFQMNSKCLNIIKNQDASIIYDIEGNEDLSNAELVDDKTMKSVQIDYAIV